MSEPPPYPITSIEPVFASDEITARCFTLSPGQEVPWHFHPTTVDEFYVLAGRLRVEFDEPRETLEVSVGERVRVEASRPHRNTPATESPCVFLNIQGPGKRSFVLHQPAERTAPAGD